MDEDTKLKRETRQQEMARIVAMANAKLDMAVAPPLEAVPNTPPGGLSLEQARHLQDAITEEHIDAAKKDNDDAEAEEAGEAGEERAPFLFSQLENRGMILPAIWSDDNLRRSFKVAIMVSVATPGRNYPKEYEVVDLLLKPLSEIQDCTPIGHCYWYHGDWIMQRMYEAGHLPGTLAKLISSLGDQVALYKKVVALLAAQLKDKQAEIESYRQGTVLSTEEHVGGANGGEAQSEAGTGMEGAGDLAGVTPRSQDAL
jgi:hypothetical protein